MQFINDALEGNKIIGLFAIRYERNDVEEPTPDDIYEYGLGRGIAKMLRAPDGTVRLIVQGLQRIRLLEITQSEPYYRARSRWCRRSSPVKISSWKASCAMCSRSLNAW